jgi:hypothetical protein
MRFLTKLIKTPEDDQNEDQDEFDAEKKGLLMIPSLPGEQEEGAASTRPPVEAINAGMPAAEGAASTRPAVEAINAGMPAAEGAAPYPPSQAEGGPAQDEVGQPPVGEGESSGATQESPLAQDPSQEIAGEQTDTEETSPDDPLHMFRATAKRTFMASALKDDLEDVPLAELLAEARSIRDSLASKEDAGGTGQGQERAA